MAPASESKRYDVRLLGPFAVYCNGEPVDIGGWQRRVQTLLKLLAIAPGRRRSRDELIDLLWPEATPQAGASNLRCVVHLLRRSFGAVEPSPVLSEQGWIALNPVHEWHVDLMRLEQLVHDATDNGHHATEALSEAMTLYRGEPLVEDLYQDWAAPVREHSRRMWRDACLRLARLHREHADHAAAIDVLQRALEADPLDEEALQLLLIELSASGRRTEALRVFRQFEAGVRDELDVAPAPETLAIVAGLRMRAEPSTAREPTRAAPPIVNPVPVLPAIRFRSPAR